MEIDIVQDSVMGRPMIHTIGHSTRPIEEFLAILTAHRLTRLIDVRTIPKSRTNPQYGQDALAGRLEVAGIVYEHVKGLGGLRHARKDSPNTGWRNDSFRGYADYMQTAEFASALDVLIQASARERVVIMCAEAVPWRCHRSLIADSLSLHGYAVEHIMSATKSNRHILTRFAKVDGTTITYPGDLDR
jgi:uncharacterized protein (DUF488 family)